MKIKTAMIMTAGLGTRLRPLTDHTPKALIKVAGRPLIDLIIEKLIAAGIEHIICNLHYHKDILRQHLEKISAVKMTLVDEDPILETGGGVVNALPHIRDDFFFILNGDSLWLDHRSSLLADLTAHWHDKMDFLLSLCPSSQLQKDGRSDYFMNEHGQLSARKPDQEAPYLFNGVRIAKRTVFAGRAIEKFSQRILFDQAEKNGRLYGHLFEGTWINIDTPDNLKEAEEKLSRHGY